jgi:hypothetical protein
MDMGRQWIGVAAGIGAGACLAVGALLLLGRDAEPGTAKQGGTKQELREVTLGRGTKLDLVLLRPLHSGIKVGTTASVVVAKDVLAEGRVVIPAGQIAKLEVVRSREASAVTSLVNQPARLEVRFLDLGLDGVRVRLCADLEDPEAPLSLTRASSDRDQASAALKSLWSHPETQRFLSDLSARMNGEGLGEDFDDPDSRRILEDVAAELGLAATKRVSADGKSVGTMLAVTDRIAQGSFESLDATEALLVVQAVAELGRLASGVDRSLRGAIKGRNISAPIGTRLTAYVARDVEVGG